MPTFIQDYDSDFTAIIAGLLHGYSGPSYAFSRYADGELALMTGRPHRAKSDHWMFGGGCSLLAKPLGESLDCTMPGWHVGISCPCHQSLDHAELLKRVPPTVQFSDRVTFATLFTGSNYYRLREIITASDLPRLCVVGCGKSADIRIPQSAVDPPWLDWQPTIDKMLDSRKPIVVAAGPLANILIHRYWVATADWRANGHGDDRQVVVDIGAALDKLIRGRRSRRYQTPGSAEAQERCEWTKATET